nr:zinc finger, CCHC-type [Tanacetum cinerariifolium]
MTTSVGNNLVLRSFFEKQKLTGPNFIDWYRQLCLQVPPEALAAHAAWVKGKKEVAVLMLLTMDLEIQRNLAHLGAYDMLQELKALYSKHAELELLQTVREVHAYKQEEDIRAIRILIAIAAYYNYEILQMDVKTTFLNGHLSEEIYMEKPEGFVNLKYPNHFFENDLIDLKASESVEDLELIQEEDTNPSLDTSLDHEEDDQDIDEP